MLPLYSTDAQRKSSFYGWFMVVFDISTWLVFHTARDEDVYPRRGRQCFDGCSSTLLALTGGKFSYQK